MIVRYQLSVTLDDGTPIVHESGERCVVQMSNSVGENVLKAHATLEDMVDDIALPSLKRQVREVREVDAAIRQEADEQRDPSGE